jgi:DNA repair exonuclease SbcCD ATPase subunit
VSDTDDEKRALTRELHEATKDARTATRELQAERERLRKDLRLAKEMIGNDFHELATRVVEEYMKGLNSALARHAGDVNEMVKAADESIARAAAELAGMKDPDAFTAEVVGRLSTDITRALDDRFIAMAEEFFRGKTDAKQPRRRSPKQALLPPVAISSSLHPFSHPIQLPGGGSRK